MKKWEYKQVYKEFNAYEPYARHGFLYEILEKNTKEINEFGAEGWELVSVVPSYNKGNIYQLLYVFKREKEIK